MKSSKSHLKIKNKNKKANKNLSKQTSHNNGVSSTSVLTRSNISVDELPKELSF